MNGKQMESQKGKKGKNMVDKNKSNKKEKKREQKEKQCNNTRNTTSLWVFQIQNSFEQAIQENISMGGIWCNSWLLRIDCMCCVLFFFLFVVPSFFYCFCIFSFLFFLPFFAFCLAFFPHLPGEGC